MQQFVSLADLSAAWADAANQLREDQAQPPFGERWERHPDELLEMAVQDAFGLKLLGCLFIVLHSDFSDSDQIKPVEPPWFSAVRGVRCPLNPHESPLSAWDAVVVRAHFRNWVISRVSFTEWYASLDVDPKPDANELWNSCVTANKAKLFALPMHQAETVGPSFVERAADPHLEPRRQGRPATIPGIAEQLVKLYPGGVPQGQGPAAVVKAHPGLRTVATRTLQKAISLTRQRR